MPPGMPARSFRSSNGPWFHRAFGSLTRRSRAEKWRRSLTPLSPPLASTPRPQLHRPNRRLWLLASPVLKSVRPLCNVSSRSYVSARCKSSIQTCAACHHHCSFRVPVVRSAVLPRRSNRLSPASPRLAGRRTRLLPIHVLVSRVAPDLPASADSVCKAVPLPVARRRPGSAEMASARAERIRVGAARFLPSTSSQMFSLVTASQTVP